MKVLVVGFITFVFLACADARRRVRSQLERCGRNYTENTGIISHLRYQNGQSCTWYIQPDPKGKSLVLTFTDFDTEKNYDVVTVYDLRKNGTISLKGKYSGKLAMFSVRLPVAAMITFKSDDSGTRMGFILKYNTGGSRRLRVNFTHPVTISSTNNHQLNYQAWVVSNDDRDVPIILTVNSTGGWRISIYNRRNSQDKELLKRILQNTITTLISSTNEILVVMEKLPSYKLSSSSFTLIAESYQPISVTVDAIHPTSITTKDATLFTRKTWRFSNVDPTGSLTLRIRCSVHGNDFISVHDGDNRKANVVNHISNGNKTAVFFSSSKDLVVVVEFLNANTTFTLNVSSGCSVSLQGETGFIESPGIEQKYKKHLKCLWKIENPSSSLLSFVILDLWGWRSNRSSTKLVVVANNKTIEIKLTNLSKNARLLSSNSTVIYVRSYYAVNQDTNHSIFNEINGFQIAYSIDCVNISRTSGGWITGDNHFGSRIQYFCNNGYILQNGTGRNCLSGGVWSNEMPYCQKIIQPSIVTSHKGLVRSGTKIKIRCLSNNGILSSRLSVVNSADLPIGNSPRVYFYNAQPIVSNKYRCKEIVHRKSIVFSDWITLIITWIDKPRVLMTNDQQQHVAVNSVVRLECHVAGGFPLDITYRWYRDNLVLDVNDRVLRMSNITKEQSGSYHCNATNGFAWKLSDVQNISVWDIGDVVISLSTPEHNVISGTDVTLRCQTTGNAVALDMLWIKNETTIVSNSSMLTIHKAQSRDSGKYQCRAAKEDVVAHSRMVKLAVMWLNEPVLGFQGNQSLVPKDSVLEITCVSDGHPRPVQYMWYKDNVRIKNTFMPTMKLNIISTAFAGRYKCKAINAFQEKMSDEKTLQVWELKEPNVIATKQDKIPMGSAVNLTCVTNQKAVLQSWVNAGGRIVSTSPMLMFPALKKTDSGQYRCKITKMGLSKYSRSITIKVSHMETPVFQFLPLSTVSVGHDVYLVCRMSGSIPIDYEIRKDGIVIKTKKNEGTSFFMTLENVQQSHAGNYSCTASNSVGRATSNNAILKVNQ